MRLQTRSDRIGGVVEVFDNVITDTSELLRVIESIGQWHDAEVGTDEGTVNPRIRDNKVKFFMPFTYDAPLPIYHMARTVMHYLVDYAQRYDFSFSGIQPINVNKYGPGERYKPHADDGPGMDRVVSALLYLNDVTEGGETEFVHFGKSVSPRAGRLIIFPANYAYAHAAHPPVSGIKYSVAFWGVK